VLAALNSIENPPAPREHERFSLHIQMAHTMAFRRTGTHEKCLPAGLVHCSIARVSPDLPSFARLYPAGDRSSRTKPDIAPRNLLSAGA